MSEAELVFQSKFDQEFLFECYGVVVKVESNARGLMLEIQERVRKAFLDRIEILESSDISGIHSFGAGVENGVYFYFEKGSQNSQTGSKSILLNFLESMIRLTVAEHAVSKVFIHAGVIGWKGKAILIPGNSYSGKTTLVAELVKNGAVYYSDEYAVLDEHGFVHAFARPLAMRGIESKDTQTDISVESLGGVAGEEPLRVGMVLITKYRPGAKWDPKLLNPGNGVIEMIPHTIPIRFNTKFALSVLNIVASGTLVVKSQRNDAKKFAKILLTFFDNGLNCDKII
ncbi:MAG: hypothetical protein H7070_00220 [Saprospiraceae bacterium]|nr:hypothetical protein [Pyrinomonadaceae bacterium]